MLASGVRTALLGFTNLDIIPLLILLVPLMLTPVFYPFRVWLEVLGSAGGCAGDGSALTALSEARRTCERAASYERLNSRASVAGQ
jgi:hypothetical protein